MILEAKHITKFYDTRKILDGINISIEEGEIISIYGSSGSGKTTLLNILGLLDSPSGGEVSYYNNLEYKNSQSIDRVSTLGYIFQSHYLLSEFKIIDNLIIPQLFKGLDFNSSRKNAEELLDLVNLKILLDKYPNEISAGEKQRIAVLRGIINKPKIVFADEPTGNLDNDNSLIIIKLLKDLKENLNISFIIATHDKQVTKISEKSFYIINGKFEQNTNIQEKL